MSKSTFADGVSPFQAHVMKDRVCLITGGASGIGLGIAVQFAQHGAKAVVVMGRRQAFLDDAVKVLEAAGTHAASVRGDVREESDCARAVQTAVDRFGGLDCLVNCAAGNFLSDAENLKPKGFRTVMEIDTVGVYNMCYSAVGPLKESLCPTIINISATLHYGATWYQLHASAAKAAIDSITRSLALEWGAYNIRINGVAPGPIAETAGMTKLSGGMDDESMSEMIAEAVPLGKMGKPWDIAMACIFLNSAAGRYITGDTLVVDGGNWLYKPAPIPREMVSMIAKQVESKSRAVGGVTSKL